MFLIFQIFEYKEYIIKHIDLPDVKSLITPSFLAVKQRTSPFTAQLIEIQHADAKRK